MNRTNTPYVVFLALFLALGSSLAKGQYICSTSSATGNCGPYGDTEVTNNAGGNSNVQNDVWNPQTGWSQTLYTVSEGRWWVTANMPSGYTGVISYPDTDILFSDWTPTANPTIDSFSYIYSSFVDTVPTTSGTIVDVGYDMWFNSYGNEVFIQTAVVNRSACTGYMTVLGTNLSFGGTNGVPTNLWNLCQNGGAGSELVFQWIPPTGTSTTFGISSGSVDIYGMLEYLESHGYLPTGSNITAIQFGFEIGSTGGVAENFYTDALSLTTSTSSSTPVITSALTANGTVGSAFSYQIAATHSPTSYSATGLPSGLSVNTSTGVISGTPTTAGTSSVTIGATNSSGTGTATLSLTVASTPAIAFVQANAGMASSASSEAVAFASNTTSGHTILVGLDFPSGSTFSSISDSQGNTFTEIGSQLTTPAGSGSRLYYAKNITGGADTVTVRTTASASFIKVQVIEYSGVSTATPIDVQAGNTGSAGSAYAGGTTTVANDWIIGFLASDGTGSAAAGFNSRSAANGNVLIDDAAGAPGSYSTEGSATSGWSMQMAALEP